MLPLVLALSGLFQAPPAPPVPIDVAALTIGAPHTVVELDLGKLKGELRQLAWEPNGNTLYIQTAEGNPQSPRLHHYWVAADGGAVMMVDAQPEWASVYWAFKSDRSAPGIGSLMIDVDQKFETLKYGTGSAGAADGGDRAGGGTVMSSNNIDREAQRSQLHVVRLTLLGETVSQFVDQPPIPGLLFGWGPEKSGAIAFSDPDGRLILFDRNKHKQTVAAAKDTMLPAWTLDGRRLAWIQKAGRKKYTLVYATVTAGR
jgi:hypothetical protein